MQGMLAFAAPIALPITLFAALASQSTGVANAAPAPFSPVPVETQTPDVAPANALGDEQKPPLAKSQAKARSQSDIPVSANPLNAWQQTNTVHQVRIEQRVIIRISPQRPSRGSQLLADLPRQGLNTRYEERKMDKCLAVEQIAGVQTGRGNRLLLFLRDRRIISLNLEKACLAREFYSGFYVEKNEDGKLCVSRDKLQSRAGSKCEVERMRQLVAVKD